MSIALSVSMAGSVCACRGHIVASSEEAKVLAIESSICPVGLEKVFCFCES